MSANTTLCICPHPALSILNRSLTREIIEHAVNNTTTKIYIFFHDNTGELKPHQRRNEEIAWYNEIYNMCLTAERPSINMIILPATPPPITFDQAFGLEQDRPTFISTFSTTTASTTSTTTATTTTTTTTESTTYIPLDNIKSIQSFLGSNDYFMYEDEITPLPTYNTVAMGGTFDNLHAGHKRLLTAAARVCTHTLTIGVTSDLYLSKKNKSYGNMIESCTTRMHNVVSFLNDINPTLNIDILPIDDGYGPTIQRAEFDSIVASSETLSGCRGINVIRNEKGWKPLAIVIVARTDEGNLSSTVIRKWKYEQEQQLLKEKDELKNATSKRQKM